MNLAFIGGGMMAQVGHLPFFASTPACRLAAIAESRPSLVEALQQAYPGVRIVERHEEVLADPTIDAVFISAPRPATGPLVLQALEAGKHVLSEKPMAHTLEQATRLAGTAATKGLHYHLGFMKRYDGGVQAAHEALADLRATGRLGRMLSARFWNYSAEYAVPPPAHVRPKESRSVRFPVWPVAPDWLDASLHGAYAWFMNAVSHDVNLLRFFLGDDLQVIGASQAEGGLNALLRNGDVLVTLEAARCAAGRWIEGAEFVFERGRLVVDIPSPMAVNESARLTLESRDGQPLGHEVPVASGWCFARQAHALAGALAGTATSLTPAADCVGDITLIEAIWRHVSA